MKHFSRFAVLLVLSVSSVLLLRGQATDSPQTPTAPPTAPTPAPSAPAATPTAPATGSNPSVMLLKQGHTEGVRVKAARDLGSQGDLSTVPALASALTDPSPKVRREVVLALAQFHQSAVLPPLEQATKDLDDSVRVAAVQCLVGYYTGVLPTSGFTGFMKRSYQRTVSHFSGDDTKVDPGINIDPTVVTTLIATMKDTRSNSASHEAAKALGILTAKAAAPDLVAAAHSSDTDLAEEALNSLSKIKDESRVPSLSTCWIRPTRM